MWLCYYCKKALTTEDQRKHRLCPRCGSDLHCCRNCIHFQENKGAQCREPNSPWVRDRSATNSCHFFEHQRADAPAEEPSNPEAERAKEAFRALFRNA